MGDLIDLTDEELSRRYCRSANGILLSRSDVQDIYPYEIHIGHLSTLGGSFANALEVLEPSDYFIERDSLSGIHWKIRFCNEGCMMAFKLTWL